MLVAETCPLVHHSTSLAAVDPATSVRQATAGVVVRASRGRVDLELAELLQRHGDGFVDQLRQRCLLLGAVKSADVDRPSGRTEIHYDPSASTLRDILLDLARVVSSERTDRATDREGLLTDERAHSAPRYDIRRSLSDAANLTGAGICLTLSVAGLALPGVPALPFVLGATYFGARVSAPVRDRLLRAPLLGRLLRHVAARQVATSPARGHAVICIAAGLMIAVFTARSRPWTIAAVALGLIELGLVLRIPGIQRQPADDPPGTGRINSPRPPRRLAPSAEPATSKLIVQQAVRAENLSACLPCSGSTIGPHLALA